jgi:hypothetical protein
MIVFITDRRLDMAPQGKSRTPPKDIFVSIAVSRAQGLTQLPGTITGAQDMAHWAQSNGYLVVHIDDSKSEVSVKRVRTKVVKAINKVHEMSPLRRIIFYFAGHGAAQYLDDTLWLLSRWRRDPSEAIRVPNLRRVLRTYQPAQVAFIGDACRVVHKDFLNTLGSAVLLNNEDENPSDFELDQFFAADAGEAAFMVVRQGSKDAFCIFTDVLLNALERGAPGSAIARPGVGFVVTSGRLATYLKSEVPLEASKHNVVLTPVPRPGFIEPRDIYVKLRRPVTLKANELPPPPSPPAFYPNAVPPSPPNVGPNAPRPKGDALRVRRERDRRESIARSLEDSFAEEKHPQRFETHSGISISGIEAKAKEIATPPDVVVTRDSKEKALFQFRVGKSDVDPMKRPFADLLVKISRDRWAYAFAVPGFITALTIRNGASVGAISRKIEIGSHKKYSDTEAIVARLNAGIIASGESYRLAAMLRERKHDNFVLGIIAAYLYDSVGDIDNIRRIATYYVQQRQPVPFDVALLTGAEIKPGLGDALIFDIPAVEPRKPRTRAERLRSYTFRAMSASRNAPILATIPLLRQGWTLLELSSWAGPSLQKWRNFLVEVRRGLTPAPFTTLRQPQAQNLAAAIRAGKPFAELRGGKS